MINVFLLKDDPNFVTRIVNKLRKRVDVKAEVHDSIQEIEALVHAGEPAVILFGPSAENKDVLAASKRISRLSAATGCIMVRQELSTELLQEALRAGLSDVVGEGLNEIIEAVEREIDVLSQAIGPQEQVGQQAEKINPVVAFFSIKGGVGKTVLAVNTAVGLAQQNKNVILLDFDTHAGDVGVMMGLRPDRTLTDLLPVIDRLDKDMLTSFLTVHESGVKVLLAPVNYQEAHEVTKEQVRRIISCARSLADYLVIDTPAAFVDHTLTVIDHSDLICLVVTLDVPSVKSTQVAMQTFDFLKFPKEKIRVLLNRADSKVSLLPSEVEKHLKHKISVQIPSDRAIPRTVNEGQPLMMNGSRSPVMAGLEKLVELVIETGNGTAERN